MTRQEAIRVLMLSPIYFRLSPTDRKELIREYCISFAKICRRPLKGLTRAKGAENNG